MPTLTPVADDPFAKTALKLTPVDHDPFADPQSGSAMGAFGAGLLHGAGNVPHGAIQMGAHVLGDGKAADEAVQQREQSYQGPFAPGPGQPLSQARSHPIAAGIGEFLGEAGATIPLAFLPGGAEGLAARTGMGAAAGAAGAALAPVNRGRDYWTEKAQQMGVGAATGGVLGGASGVLAPALTPEARGLAQQGVRLTPGQSIGGRALSVERAMQAFPVIGAYVRGKIGRSVDDFNRAAAQQALEPIGAIVPRSVKAGDDLIDFARNQLSTAYNRLLPRMTVDRSGLESALNNNPDLVRFVGTLSDDHVRRLQRIVNSEFGRFGAAGQLPGDVFKRIESNLSGRAASFNQGTNDHELGQALRMVLDTMRTELERQNPALGADLQRVNAAYAMFSRLRSASQRGTTDRISPDDLWAVTKDGTRASTPLRALARAGQSTLGGKPLTYPERVRIGSFLLEIPDMGIGAAATVPYAAVGALQRVPLFGKALGVAAPAAGAAMGAAASPAPRQPPKVGDKGPAGGTVTGTYSVKRPSPPRRAPSAEDDYIEPPGGP